MHTLCLCGGSGLGVALTLKLQQLTNRVNLRWFNLLLAYWKQINAILLNRLGS